MEKDVPSETIFKSSRHYRECGTRGTARMPGLCFKLGVEFCFGVLRSCFTVYSLDVVSSTELSGLKIAA